MVEEMRRYELRGRCKRERVKVGLASNLLGLRCRLVTKFLLHEPACFLPVFKT